MTYFGAHALPRTPEKDQRESTLALETQIGRTLGIMRRYAYWDSKLPDDVHVWARDGGRIPYIAWHAYLRDGTVIPWKDIALGKYDDVLTRTAMNLKAFGTPIYFAFHHEPENDPNNGTPEDFKAAFEHVRTMFEGVGATNLHWICTLMGVTYRNDRQGLWLPEPNYYSLVGVDGYNRWPVIDKPTWRSFGTLVTDARDVARSLHKPLFVGEYGCTEDPSAPFHKANWFKAMAATVKHWGDVEAVCYSHAMAVFQGQTVPYWADTSTASIEAFRAVSHDPYFADMLADPTPTGGIE